MKYLKSNILLFLLSVLVLFTGCEQQDGGTTDEVKLQPGTPAYFYEQGLNTADLEEKLRLYNAGLEEISNKTDTNLVALLEGKIYALSRLGKYHASEAWIDSLITAAKFQNDTFYLAKGYYRKSLLNAIRNQRELQFENAFIARQLNLAAGDTFLAARRSLDMATAQMEMGDYPGCQESAAETLEYLKPRNKADSIFVSAAHNLIGLAYMDQGFYEDAVKEYQNALIFSAREKDSLTFLHNIALTYKNQGNYEKAIGILEELAASKVPDSNSRSHFIDNLAYTRWLKDSTARVDSLLFTALEMRKLQNDWSGLTTSYFHLADYYENKDKDEAIKYAKASLEAARKNSSATSEVKALEKLISLLEGNVAKNYMERYIFLHDSLDKATLKAKNYFAKIRFDQKRKQQEINSLEQINYKQALKAEQLQNQNLVTSLGLILVFLTTVLLFYYSWNKNKREKITEVYRAEKRISKRIHDELANDLYDLMSTVQHEARPATADRLEKIYYRTRDISRENSEIDTGNDYLAGLVGIMSSLAGNTKIILKGEKSVSWQNIAEEKKIVIYRVLQELMINMKKHSKAKFVAVSFTVKGKWLEINYKDTGEGCEPSSLTAGSGIKNIRSRMASINGKIHIESKKGQGFQVSIRVPA